MSDVQTIVIKLDPVADSAKVLSQYWIIGSISRLFVEPVEYDIIK